MSSLKEIFKSSAEGASELYKSQIEGVKRVLHIPSKETMLDAYKNGENYVVEKYNSFKQTETGKKLSDIYHAGTAGIKDGVAKFAETDAGKTAVQASAKVARGIDSFLSQFQNASPEPTDDLSAGR